MKAITRTAVVAACAGPLLCTAALAQSQVTVYGVVDMSAGRVQNSGTPAVIAVDSGKRFTSYLGFGGQEDLGEGLSVLFGIETWLALDTGATLGNAFWARRANVGLKSDYGSLWFGNTPTALFVQSLTFAPYANSQGLAPTQRWLFSRYAATEGGTAWQNSIQYQTPDLDGFSSTLQVALKESAGGRNSHAASLMYAKGPLAVGVAWQEWRIAAADQNTVLVGASCDFGVVKVYAQYGEVDDKANGDDQTYAQLGVRVPVGAGALLASYGHTKVEATNADHSVRTATFGYDHSLSKRTIVYATGMVDKLSDAERGITAVLGLRHMF